MQRHDTAVEDGILYIELPEDRLEVGEIHTIVDLVGGPKYSVEYTSQQASVSWLPTTDGVLTFDVVETIAEMDFRTGFVDELSDAPLDETDESGCPIRTERFADLMTTIWKSNGDSGET